MPNDGALNIDDIQTALAGSRATWQAAESDHFLLSLRQKRRRLGAVPPATTLAAREQRAAGRSVGAETAATGRPPTFDWRSHGGHNYVTPIRDQGYCGSCVAFGTAATVEATARVLYGHALPIDVSEAQLFYCVGATKGATCDAGWWPDDALQGFANPGITDGAHFPYTAGDRSCGLRIGWQDHVTKVGAWHVISSVSAMKDWISTRGPLTACFSVYDDFYSYVSGVYTQQVGELLGGHCVSIVGYDDTQQCWIAKNSWGTGFGHKGFFRIGYGQCGIDAEMWSLDSVFVPSTGTVPLYRYRRDTTGRHYYTTQWAELGAGRNGWRFEETQCYVYPTARPGTVPLYRYHNAQSTDYLYTTNWNELGSGKSGYVYQAIQCYVYPGAGQQTARLYRYVKTNGANHFYTTNPDEVRSGGWRLQGTQMFTPAGPGAAGPSGGNASPVEVPAAAVTGADAHLAPWNVEAVGPATVVTDR